MAAFMIISGISKKPTITEEKFPFFITCELNGKEETIEGVYRASFVGHVGFADPKSRIYEGKIEGRQDENDTVYILSENEDGYIALFTNLYADYLMGDPQYDYFSGGEFEPKLLYYDFEGMEYDDEATLQEQGVTLVSWIYSLPVENNFVFSHIAFLSSRVIFPTVFIGVLTLLAMIIFVRKEKEFKNSKKNKISLLCNFIIGILVISFMTVFASLMDIGGVSAAFNQQMSYITPAFSILCLAASVGVRRKNYDKAGLLVQFAGPVVFTGIIISYFI